MNSSIKNKIIVILGPTASGKSELAVKIAKKIGGEIISADSRQIYRGMDIGTAKPTKKEIAGIKHHLIDIKNPDENYTVAEYKRDAVNAIEKVLRKGRIPILVGGTGLYIQAMVDNLEIPEVKPNLKLRKKIEGEIKRRGLAYVFKKLVKLDPEAAYVVDPKNPRRIVRALEVAILTGKPFTGQRKKGKPLFEFLQIGIKIPDKILQKRIEARTKMMIRQSLVSEVKKLIKKYGKKQRAFDAIGYREIIDYLDAKTTLPEAVQLINTNTHRFVKRQMTWFKRDKRIKWLRAHEESNLDQWFWRPSFCH